MYVFGKPVVDGATVREFLGGQGGNLVYTKFEGEDSTKNGRSLWYVGFNEDELVERKILQEEGREPRNPIISPDGKWVAYNTIIKYDTVKTKDGIVDTSTRYKESKSYICKLAKNTQQKVFIAEGAHPHWWNMPGTNKEYIIYNNGDLEECWQCKVNWTSKEECKYPGGGYTYIMQLEDKEPSGEAHVLLPYYANAGRSKNGKWLFTSGRVTTMYEVDSLSTSNTQYKKRTIFEEELWGCNPSTSPHESDSNVRVMYLNVPHNGFYIAKTDGEIVDSIMKDPSDGNGYWDTPEWSTHKNFATVVGSKESVQPPYDIYLFRVSDGAVLKVLEGNYHWPHLWVGDYVIDAKYTKRSTGTSQRVTLTLSQKMLVVKNATNANVIIRVLNLQGKLLQQHTSSDNIISIEPRMGNGVHIIEAITSEGVYRMKFVKR